MRITIGGSEAFSRSYSSFDEFMDEYFDHLIERGHRVPDYDLSVLLSEIAAWFLAVAGERAVNELINEMQIRKEDEEARKAHELAETRHSELMAKMEELQREIGELRRGGQDYAAVSALLQWLRKENISIDTHLETEAEVTLKNLLRL